MFADDENSVEMLDLYNQKSDLNINLYLIKKIFEYLYTFIDKKLKTVFETLFDRIYGLFGKFFNHIKVLEEYKSKVSKTRSNEEQLRRKIVDLEGKLMASKNTKIQSKNTEIYS